MYAQLHVKKPPSNMVPTSRGLQKIYNEEKLILLSPMIILSLSHYVYHANMLKMDECGLF